MRVTTPVRLGHLEPTRAIRKLARQGEPLDFTNGVSVDDLPYRLLSLAASVGFAPTEGMGLALHGHGSVLPHNDSLYGNAALVWLVADSNDGSSHLMVARGGEAGVMAMSVGDVVLFDHREIHAWVSRSRWAMLVLDVSSVRRDQYKAYRLPTGVRCPS